MTISLQAVLEGLSPELRQRVQERKETLVRQHLILKEMREVSGDTQKELARRIGVSQANISQMEKRNDPTLSQLQEYAAALGGRLSIVYDVPGKGRLEMHDIQA